MWVECIKTNIETLDSNSPNLLNCPCNIIQKITNSFIIF